MNAHDSILIAGARGMVGSAIVRALQSAEFSNLLTPSKSDVDFRDQTATNRYFETHKPHYVFLAAAKVGGILANWEYGADFIYDNLMIQTNIIHASYTSGVKKLLFLGSSCIYPKEAPQPLKEEYLLSGPLEITNEAYAVAKIAGIKMCQAYNRQYGTRFISVMPTNLYGPNDNYDLHNSHVLPALIRKFHEAKLNGEKDVTVWGSGRPRREFLHSDDLANACLFLMEHYEDSEIVNIGCGEDVSISELANLVKDIVGFSGNIVFDSSKPDGTPRKLMDVSKLTQLGWYSSIDLRDGITSVYHEKFGRVAKHV